MLLNILMICVRASDAERPTPKPRTKLIHEDKADSKEQNSNLSEETPSEKFVVEDVQEVKLDRVASEEAQNEEISDEETQVKESPIEDPQGVKLDRISSEETQSEEITEAPVEQVSPEPNTSVDPEPERPQTPVQKEAPKKRRAPPPPVAKVDHSAPKGIKPDVPKRLTLLKVPSTLGTEEEGTEIASFGASDSPTEAAAPLIETPVSLTKGTPIDAPGEKEQGVLKTSIFADLPGKFQLTSLLTKQERKILLAQVKKEHDQKKKIEFLIANSREIKELEKKIGKYHLIVTEYVPISKHTANIDNINLEAIPQKEWRAVLWDVYHMCAENSPSLANFKKNNKEQITHTEKHFPFYCEPSKISGSVPAFVPVDDKDVMGEHAGVSTKKKGPLIPKRPRLDSESSIGSAGDTFSLKSSVSSPSTPVIDKHAPERFDFDPSAESDDGEESSESDILSGCHINMTVLNIPSAFIVEFGENARVAYDILKTNATNSQSSDFTMDELDLADGKYFLSLLLSSQNFYKTHHAISYCHEEYLIAGKKLQPKFINPAFFDIKLREVTGNPENIAKLINKPHCKTPLDENALQELKTLTAPRLKFLDPETKSAGRRLRLIVLSANNKMRRVMIYFVPNDLLRPDLPNVDNTNTKFYIKKDNFSIQIGSFNLGGDVFYTPHKVKISELFEPEAVMSAVKALKFTVCESEECEDHSIFNLGQYAKKQPPITPPKPVLILTGISGASDTDHFSVAEKAARKEALEKNRALEKLEAERVRKENLEKFKQARQARLQSLSKIPDVAYDPDLEGQFGPKTESETLKEEMKSKDSQHMDPEIIEHFDTSSLAIPKGKAPIKVAKESPWQKFKVFCSKNTGAVVGISSAVFLFLVWVGIMIMLTYRRNKSKKHFNPYNRFGK